MELGIYSKQYYKGTGSCFNEIGDLMRRERYKAEAYMDEYDMWNQGNPFEMTHGDWAIRGLVIALFVLEIL